MCDPKLSYRVDGRLASGLRAFLCPTPQWALRKLADFEKSGYADISATGPSGPITEAELRRLIEEPETPVVGAPVRVVAPSVPAMA